MFLTTDELNKAAVSASKVGMQNESPVEQSKATSSEYPILFVEGFCLGIPILFVKAL